MTSNRVMINALEGIFELEGDADFVDTQLDKLLPLVKSGGFAKAPALPEADEEEVETPEAGNKPPPAKKGARGKSSRPPKGHSCADRMLELRNDGFFKEKKTPAQIVEGLGVKGWTHTSNQVSAAGGQMFKRGDIQRTKEGLGFAYYWDRG